MADTVYAACMAAADWCHHHRRLVLLIGAPAYTLLIVSVGTFVLERFPNSGDEYVYLYQAATLVAGRVSNPAPAVPGAFEFSYITQHGDRAFGTFPPGWPLALAIAARLHVPVWLVNPLFGIATLVALWALARELHGRRVAVLAAGIVAISPFFVFNAASFFSHTFCGLMLVLGAYAATVSDRHPAAGPLAAGASVGWAVLTRYFAGVVGAAGIAVLLVSRTRPRHLQSLARAAVGGMPFAVLLGAYNVSLSGSPWQFTTLPLTRSLWFAPGFALRGLDILSTQVLQFILWTPPALLAAYLWYVRRAPRLLDWMFVVMAVMLIFYVNRGGNQYGPRFYYEAFLFLAVFTTAKLFSVDTLEHADRATRRLFVAMAVSVAVLPLIAVVHARNQKMVVHERADVFARVADAHLTKAVVLLAGRIGTARSMDARDLTRNGIDHASDVLYALDRGPAENCALAAAHPGRSMYQYVWDGSRRRGELRRVLCR